MTFGVLSLIPASAPSHCEKRDGSVRWVNGNPRWNSKVSREPRTQARFADSQGGFMDKNWAVVRAIGGLFLFAALIGAAIWVVCGVSATVSVPVDPLHKALNGKKQ